MFWIEFIVLMLIIVWGTRKGGSFRQWLAASEC